MTRPLPLSVPINARPPSDRLPLAFRRPLSGKPEDGGHAPSVPGRIPVAKSWGFATYEAADAAVCAAQAQAAAGVLLDWAHLPKGSAGTAACIATATADTAALYLDRTAGHTPSVRRAGCTHTASKDAPPLRHCGRSTTAAAAPRYRCTPAAQTAAGRLKTCIRPRHGATDGAGICRPGRVAPAADIHTCRRAETETAKIPPCEYYPLPIPEPQPDGHLKTYICEPRPKGDRMHLRFRRKKLGHAADRIPLAFACHTVQGVPVRKAYIMLNRVTASFDNGKPLDILAASFAADTGGYCWQCSVTLPPDSFARLNMDGRDKGKEAVITVKAAGHTFTFIAEEYGDTRRFGQKDYTVSGRSLTAYLGADYGKPGSGTYQNAAYARQIADAQLEFSGFKVIGWHIPDWLVAGGSYAVTGKTPMTVLQELAKAAGGFVESDPHLPVVRIKPRWPKAAWQIAEAAPDATVPSSVILQIGGRRTVSERCNGVFVWAEHAKGRAGDVYRQGGSREPRAAALTDTLYTDTDVLTAAGMAALSDTGIHKTETVLMPVSEKYGIPLAQLGQIWQIQEPEGHWQGVITGITLTVESENGAPKITQSAVIDRYMDK